MTPEAGLSWNFDVRESGLRKSAEGTSYEIGKVGVAPSIWPATRGAARLAAPARRGALRTFPLIEALLLASASSVTSKQPHTADKPLAPCRRRRSKLRQTKAVVE